MNNRSFTLIELLVVIAIVGILSGIVLMSSSGAVNSAQDTRIKNDIDSIRKAILSYKALYGVAPIEDPVCNIGSDCSQLSSDLLAMNPNISFPTNPLGGYYTYYSVDGTDFTITAILSDGQILNYAFDEGFSYNVSFSNPIINGSFDGTWTGWSTSGGASIKSVNDTTAYLGSYASYLNYELTCADERIYQNITIPNAYGIINLDFWEKTYLNYWGGSSRNKNKR